MLEMIFKSNALLDLIDPSDDLKLMEMSINRHDILCKLIKSLSFSSGQEQVSYHKTRQTILCDAFDHHQSRDQT